MIKEIVIFGDIEIDKHKFHKYKSPVLTGDVNMR